MARSRSRRERDVFTPHIPSLEALLSIKLTPLLPISPVTTALTPVAIAELGDRRRWRPDASTAAPAASVKAAARVVSPPPPAVDRMQFADPNAVALCARRKRRREVLFALKKTKKGSGAKRKRNFWSDVKC